MSKEISKVTQPSLYSERFEHDNCGIGAVVNIKGIKTHQTVENALKIVENLEHRAGKDAEGKTGDGVGILLQISHKFFSKAAKEAGIRLGGERDYGVGMFFFPQDELKRRQAMKMFEIIVNKEGMEFLGWRNVPTEPTTLGQKAIDCMPCIMQGFVKRPADVAQGIDFDRKLIISCRDVQNAYRISVYNSGKPISGTDLENIWQSFYRADKAHSRSEGRFGLGLSIVSTIQDLHKQKYGVNNKEHGVEFWFDVKKA